ncbi:hypothetical protein N657DRAFT_461055 [Parathielavia appendiculata]|uniref:Uncharacterized protein n=1 Tax=Parathielavia appendiculata TaxID=2587402 RepID=A0AAN6U061_9PEZI|nr:hypothetical protein N657DRAFT_461055 [Parathielavia appendiculata]
MQVHVSPGHDGLRPQRRRKARGSSIMRFKARISVRRPHLMGAQDVCHDTRLRLSSRLVSTSITWTLCALNTTIRLLPSPWLAPAPGIEVTKAAGPGSRLVSIVCSHLLSNCPSGPSASLDQEQAGAMGIALVMCLSAIRAVPVVCRLGIASVEGLPNLSALQPQASSMMGMATSLCGSVQSLLCLLQPGQGLVKPPRPSTCAITVHWMSKH